MLGLFSLSLNRWSLKCLIYKLKLTPNYVDLKVCFFNFRLFSPIVTTFKVVLANKGAYHLPCILIYILLSCKFIATYTFLTLVNSIVLSTFAYNLLLTIGLKQTAPQVKKYT